MWEAVKKWAWRVRQDTVAVYIASRDPRTPWYAKTIAVSVTAYVLSPVDLIPDFIPPIGYLDDFLLLPLGMLLAVRLIPQELMREFRKVAQTSKLPSHWAVATIIIAAWFASASAAFWWAYSWI